MKARSSVKPSQGDWDFRALFDSMVEGAVLHEIVRDDKGVPTDYRILAVNPAFEQIVGINREQAAGALASQLYGAGEAPYLETYARVAETGEPASFETFFEPMDKHFRISVFSPGRGRFATVFTDVTAFRREEEELRRHRDHLEELVDERTAELKEQHARFVAVLESFPEVLYVADPKTHEVLLVNRRYRELLGRDPVGETCYSALQGKDEPCDFCRDPELGRPGSPPSIWEHHNELLDRDYLHLDQLIDWPDGREVRMGVAVDVTGQRRAERRATVMAEHLPRGVVHILDRELCYVHSAGEELKRSKYSAEELKGHTIFEMMSPSNAEKAARHFRRALDGESVTFEGQFGGSYFLVSAVPLRSATGEVERILVLSINIDDRHRAEDALDRVNDELARSNAELEQFAYVASHDLKEPLRKIASFTELLAKRYRGRLDDRADEFIGYITDGARRMQLLVDDLLAFSRVGRRGQPFEPTESGAALERAVGNLTTTIRESGAKVTHGELPVVTSDPVQLEQLFQNLVGNAVKFRGEDPPEVHVSAERSNRGWCFTIRDNGIGIAPEYHERVFELFRRLHGRGQYPGTGIGLALCRKIVERHGGNIWVESEPGKGSSFHFTIHENGGNNDE